MLDILLEKTSKRKSTRTFQGEIFWDGSNWQSPAALSKQLEAISTMKTFLVFSGINLTHLHSLKPSFSCPGIAARGLLQAHLIPG